MRCPYCVSDIPEAAVVCPVCRRDLYLLKPLLDRIAQLEQQLAQRADINSPLPPEAADALPAAGAMAVQEESCVWPTAQEWLSRWVLPLVLLLAAHAVIVMVYDLNTAVLRVVSLLIPLPFGLLLAMPAQRPRWLMATMAVLLAALAVIGMSSLVAVVDGTPVLPVGFREWREFCEYATSIGLSYVSGMLIGRMIRQRALAQSADTLSHALANAAGNGASGAQRLQVSVNRFNELGSALTMAATTLAAVYTGLRSIIGA